MALTAASLLIDVDADTSKADRALASLPGKLQNVAGAASGAGSSLSDMFAVSGGVMMAQTIQNVTSSIWGLGQTALQSYAFSERLGASMQAMLSREMVHAGVAGSVEELRAMPEAMGQVQERAKELQQWMERFAIQSPFTYEDVSTAFRLAQTYGFTSTQATRLTEATANFASGSGQTGDAIKRVSMALGQMRTTGKVLTQDLRQMTNVGVDVYGALSRAFQKPTAEIITMIQKGLIPADQAIEAIVSSLEQDFGAAAKEQAGTVTGLMASMSDIVPMRARDLFAGIIRTVQPYLDQLVSGLVDESNIGRIKQIGDMLGVYVGGALEVLTTALSRFTTAFGEARSAVGGIVSGFAAMLMVPEWVAGLGLFMAAFSALTPVISGFGVIATNAVTAIGVALAALSSPITAVAAALVLLYAAWDTNFGGIKDITDAASAVVAHFFNTFNGAEVNTTAAYLALRKMFGVEMATDIIDATRAIGNYVAVIMDAGVHSIESAEALSLIPDNLRHYGTLFEFYADGVQNAIALVSNVFQRGIAPEQEYFEVMDVFGTEAAKKLFGFAVAARQAMLSVTQTIQGAVSQVQEIAGAIWFALSDPGRAANAVNLYERLGIEPTMVTQAVQMVVNLRTQLLAAFNQIAAVITPAIGRLGAAWNNMLVIFRAPVFMQSLLLLRDAFFSVGGALGNFVSTFAPIVVALGVVLTDFGINIASGILSRLPFFFEILVRTLTSSLNTIAALINSAAGIIRAALAGDWGAILGELQNVWGTLVSYAEGVFFALQDSLTLIWMTMWLGMRRTAADFGIDLEAVVTGVWDMLGGFGAMVNGALQPAIAVFVTLHDWLTAVFGGIPALFGAATAPISGFGAVMQLLGAVFGSVSGMLAPVLQRIQGAWESFTALFTVDAIGASLTLLWGIFDNLAGVLSGFASNIGRALGVVGQVMGIFRAALIGDWNSVFGELKAIWVALGTYAEGAFAFLGDVLGSVWNSIWQGMLNVAANFGVSFSTVMTSVGNALGGFGAIITTALQPAISVFSALQTWLATAFSGLPAFFAGVEAPIGLFGVAVQQLGVIFNQISAALAPAIGRLRTAWDSMIQIFASPVVTRELVRVEQSLRALGQVTGAILAPVIRAFVSLGVVLVDFGINLAGSFLPRLPILISIMARTLSSSLQTITGVLQGITNIVRAVMVGDFSTIATESQAIWGRLTTFAEQTFNNFGRVLDVIWSGLWTALVNTAADFGVDLDAVLANVKNMLGGLGATIASALQPAIDVLAPMFARLVATFSGLPARFAALAPQLGTLGAALQQLGASAIPYLQILGTILGGLVTIVVSFAGNFINAFAGSLPGMVGTLINQFTLLANTLSTIFDDIVAIFQGIQAGDWGAVAGNIGNIFYTLTDTFFASLLNWRDMFAGMWNVFVESIGNTLKDIGVADAFDAVIAGLGNFFAPVGAAWDAIIAFFSSSIAAVIGFLNNFGSILSGWSTAIGSTLSAAWDSIRGALGAIGAFFSTSLPTAFLFLQTRWIALWARIQTAFAPVIAILQPAIARLQSAFAALASRFAALAPRFAGLRAALEPIMAAFGGLGAAFNAGGETLQRFVDDWVARIKQWVAETILGGLSMLGELGTLPGRVGQFLQDMATRVSTFDWGAAWATIVANAQNVGGQLQTAIANWLPLLQAGWNTVVTTVQTFDWGATWTTIVAGIQNAGISIQNAIAGWQPYAVAGWNTVKSALIAAGNTLGVDLAPTFATVETGWSTMWTNLQTTASTAWGNVSPNLQAMWQWLQVNLPVAFATVWIAGTAAWNNIGTTIDSVWQGIQTALTNMQTFFTTTLPAAFTTMQTKWDELWAALDLAFQPVRDVLEPAFTRLQTAFTEMGDKFSGLTPNVTALKDALQPVIDLFATIAEKLNDASARTTDYSGDLVIFQGVAAAFTATVGTLFAGMVATWAVVATVGINTLSAIFGGLPGMIGGAIDLTASTIRTITGVFGEVVAGVQALISGDWQNAWNSFKNAGRIAIDGLNAWIAMGAMGVGTTILGIKDIIVNSLKDLGIDITPLENAIEGVKGALDGLKDWIGGLSFPNPFDPITQWASDAIDQINRVLALIPGGIQIPTGGYVAKAGTTGGSSPDERAKGGIVPGGLTLVGEEGPELVILPKGANVVPNGLTEQVAAMLGIPGFAEGTLPTGTQPRLSAVAPTVSGAPMGGVPMWAAPTNLPQIANTITADSLAVTSGNVMVAGSDSFMTEGSDALVDASKVAESAFKKAADKAQSMLQSALQGVEGLFSSSKVTQDQLDLAELGIPQNFADDYLRQLTDEVLNGVDWAGVDIQDAAKRAGIDPSLPIDAILKLFTNAWNDSSLFANKENLDLINQKAVADQLQAQQQQALGKQNVMELFGITPDEATMQANAAYATLLEGMSANLPVDLVTAQGATMRLTFMNGFNTPVEGEAETMKTAIVGMFPGIEEKDMLPVTTNIMNSMTASLGTSLTEVGFADRLAGAMIGTVTTEASVATLETIGGRIWKVIWGGIVTGSRGSNVSDIIPPPPTGGTTSDASTDGTPTEPPTTLAVGTRYHPGGLSLVGELGPELVNFNRGARVWTNSDTTDILRKAQEQPAANAEPTIVIQNVHVHNDMDVEALGYRLQQLARRRGK